MQILSVVQVYLSKVNKLSMIGNNMKLLYQSLNHLTTQTKISKPIRDVASRADVARSNWVITKLSGEGRIHEARKVFDEMPERDVVTWTAAISGYVRCGMMEEARRLFDSADALKDVVTWTVMVRGYMRLNLVDEAERLFDAMPVKNVVSWNTMISGYVQKGEVDKALEHFTTMPEKNVVSWNTMITMLMQHRRVEEGRKLFDEMPERDVISWTALLTGLAKNGRIDEAKKVFDKMPIKNVVSWNAMINGYVKNMRLVEAFELFRAMPERNSSSWNSMITGFVINWDLDKARELFDRMPGKDIISWTTMITAYIQVEESEAALRTFVEMMRSLVKPNEATFVNVLSACGSLAGLCEGEQVHQLLCKTAYQNKPFVISALMSVYSKCGELGIARKIFESDMTSQSDLVCWNSIITAYAHHGRGKDAIKLFHEMQSLGFKPNEVTYLEVLTACSHSGLVKEGFKLFNELVNDGSIQVREDHYTCLVDLFSRAGNLKEACDMIRLLEMKHSPVIWGALHAGYSAGGDLSRAKELPMSETESINMYLSWSKMYASKGKWREAAMVREEMKEKGLKKQPGCSWIKVGNKVHVFVVGDKHQSQTSHYVFCTE